MATCQAPGGPAAPPSANRAEAAMTPTTADLTLSAYTLRHSVTKRPGVPRVLIVDPDPAIRIGLAELLRSYGIQVVGAVATVSEAVETGKVERPTVVIAETHGHGLGMVDELHIIDPRLPVIVHSSMGQDMQPWVHSGGGFALMTKGETDGDYFADVIGAAHTFFVRGARGWT
jgi:hypothetical protein